MLNKAKCSITSAKILNNQRRLDEYYRRFSDLLGFRSILTRSTSRAGEGINSLSGVSVSREGTPSRRSATPNKSKIMIYNKKEQSRPMKIYKTSEQTICVFDRNRSLSLPRHPKAGK